jgi:nucleotide-binding universal stress UspA family protein
MDETPHQVVVGVDGSAECHHALGWAVALAPLLAAEVVAVHGVGLLDRIAGELVLSHPHIDDLRKLVEDDWCRPLAEAGVGFRVEVVERAGVDALLAAAGEKPTELVIVGTRGRGLARDKAIGSTALQLLRRADVPVLVVPGPQGKAPSARRIAVGFDGSPDAHAALDWATALAGRTGATCDVAVAVPPGGAGSDRLRALAEEACAPLRDQGLPCEVSVGEGAPAETVVHLAADYGADLVVVGSSGEGAAGDPLEGSVSRLVAHDAGRPVVVVPRAAG